MTPYMAGKSLRDNFPQIEREVYVSDNNPVFYKDGRRPRPRTISGSTAISSTSVPLPLVRCDNALNRITRRPHPIRSRARFGTDNVVGHDDPDHPRVPATSHHACFATPNSHAFAIISLIHIIRPIMPTADA
jgi:hypothetical protein